MVRVFNKKKHERLIAPWLFDQNMQISVKSH